MLTIFLHVDVTHLAIVCICRHTHDAGVEVQKWPGSSKVHVEVGSYDQIIWGSKMMSVRRSLNIQIPTFHDDNIFMIHFFKHLSQCPLEVPGNLIIAHLSHFVLYLPLLGRNLYVAKVRVL